MKVLVADEIDERAEALRRHLAASGVTDVVRVAAGEQLVEAVKEHTPDVVIVDMSRADRDGLEPIREVSASSPKPIVMFSDSDDPEFMADAIEAGVSSYNVRGTALPDVKSIAQAAVAIFRRYRKLAEDLQTAEARLADLEAVKDAKHLLMRDHGISEHQAYKWLREQAMDSGKRIVDIAREVLASRHPKLPRGGRHDK